MHRGKSPVEECIGFGWDESNSQKNWDRGHAGTGMGENGRRMARMKKRVPNFASEDEERKFWAKHDSTDFVDWQTAQRVKLPNLKPSLRTFRCGYRRR